MISNDQILNLFEILKSANGEDPLTLQRIAFQIGVPSETVKQRNALRYRINQLKKYPELDYLANIGKGYFIPEYDYEYEEVHNTFRNRSNGLAKTAIKFKNGIHRAKKSSRSQDQISFDFGDIETK